jgi:hypothetical protein
MRGTTPSASSHHRARTAGTGFAGSFGGVGHKRIAPHLSGEMWGMVSVASAGLG